MLFCPECGNRIIEIIKEGGKLFGICRNKHKTLIDCLENGNGFRVEIKKQTMDNKVV
jgi:hypothetical protein